MSIYDTRREIAAAESAQSSMTVALIDFHAACVLKNWIEAEQARIRAQTYLDIFCDHVAAAMLNV